MVNIVFKKITTILKPYGVSLVVLLIISACDFVTVDAAEDSGFDLTIKNYSDKEYNNCIFYMGFKDVENKFIATDSLVFTNIIIYKKGDGEYYNSENSFSSTDLFDKRREGLNKYGMWAPTPKVINAYYKTGEIFFKVNLEGKVSISSPIKNLNGWMSLEVLENGELSW